MHYKSDYETRSELIRRREIVYLLDLAGNFTFLNRTGEQISGYSREEACRMNITEVVAPEFAASVRKQISGNVQGQFGTVLEIEIVAKSGRRVVLEVSTDVILRDGKPVEIRGIAVPPPPVADESPSQSPVTCLDPDLVFGTVA